jgi:signal transduction histidine kinase
MRSLRAKLALSHIIPTLLLMPILSLFLLYALEGFYTQSLVQQLVYQAQLLRTEAERDPGVIASADAAREFLNIIAPLTDSRVLLLSRDATILASTRQEDMGRIGSRFEQPSVAQALRGEMAQGVGPGFTTDVAYVVLPLRQNNQIIGALRLSYEVTDVRAQFSRLRWLIVGGITLTVVLALGLALGLATTITQPLRQLSEGAHKIATGNYRARVDVQGRDEVGTLARSFNQMVSRLNEAEQARERQLAAIAHELARPLAGMRAAIETLQDDAYADAEMRDTLLTGIAEELGRLERLVGTLQNVHKHAVRPMQLNRSEVAPERVIHASVANFEAVAAQTGITLSVEMPPKLPLIHADEDRLIQVLTNLLDNAFKFTPRNGRVTVQAGENEQGVWVSVADTGVGIAPDELPHVFQQFYRGDESRPPERRGMGLGLAICREIITAHRGQIKVESELLQGARFTFILPKG